MAKIVVFGTGKISEQMFYYLHYESLHKVVAFTVDREFIPGKEFLGRPVVPFEEIENWYHPKEYEMFVAVGYQDLNRFRARKCRGAREKDYKLISHISPRASNVGKVAVGRNCLVLEFSIIQPCVHIGYNVFIWSGNHLGHHASIGDNCYLSGQVVVSGGAIIGEGCFIGVNATIGHEVTIGKGSFIGAGTLVTKDVAPGSVIIAEDTPKYRLDAEAFMKLSKMEGLNAAV